MDEGEANVTCFARHYGPDEGSRKKRGAIRGGNFNNGANCSLVYLNLNNAPSNTNTNIGFRGIPFANGMRDHGCGKISDQQYIIRKYPSLNVAEYKTGSGEVVGMIRTLPAHN